MTIAQIRKQRGVPAKKGMRIFYRYAKRFGTITGARYGQLRIRLDGDINTGSYHPTWCLDYLNENGETIFSSPVDELLEKQPVEESSTGGSK